MIPKSNKIQISVYRIKYRIDNGVVKPFFYITNKFVFNNDKLEEIQEFLYELTMRERKR